MLNNQDATVGVTPETPVRRRPLGRRLLLDSAYSVTSLPIGVATLVIVSVGLTAGAGMLVVWVGLPILVATLVTASWFARFERWRLEQWLDRDVARPLYRPARAHQPLLTRLLMPLRDPQKWLDVLWSLVGWLPGTVSFMVVVVLWAEVLGGATYALWGNVGRENFTLVSDLTKLLGAEYGRAEAIWFHAASAVVAALVLPWGVRGAAWVSAASADLVLNARGAVDARVRRADEARAAAQSAEAVALRRLERDIHDGPQQRLVRLGMDLGRAKRLQTTDPERAELILDDALRQARDTLDELRSLSRGIAPPLLVDRGLGVALDELAARSAVPVTMTHAVPSGLGPHVETAVYFTVSEALTNVAKHSGAESATVEVGPDGDVLLVRVTDTGAGGAHLGKGHGLAGLRQRVAAVEGTFDVRSPLGGPTVVTARIPLQ
ncbi:sensor histidine kinase [Nocardioides yefusunii]|uniref:histidine kinase n=1 Tax=Nocardioides yefusunii TaxID=2500546 RepID=A0ABW1QZ28_9ACTN|nr:sensor histidine kinase [Nocardioides yefusunii]